MIPRHVHALADTLVSLPLEEIEQIFRDYEGLSAEAATVREVMSASQRVKTEARELLDYVLETVMRRTDAPADTIAWSLIGPLQVYLVEDVMAGNTDPVRATAWNRISSLTAKYMRPPL